MFVDAWTCTQVVSTDKEHKAFEKLSSVHASVSPTLYVGMSPLVLTVLNRDYSGG